MALPPSDQPGIVRIEQPGTDLETYVTLRAYRRVWYDRGWRSPLDDPEWAGSGDPSPAAAWIRSTEKGAAGGVATLDEAGQVPAEQLPNATSSAPIRVTFDGGGSAITTGAKQAYLSVTKAGTITRARLLADQAGDIVIDVWKDTYANFPPTDADSITASAPPTLSSAQSSEDSTLTGWTTSLAVGDVLEFNVDSAATVTKVVLELWVDPA